MLDAVQAKLEGGETLKLEDRRSGEHLVVVDISSPSTSAETFR